jgi:mannose-6-phosphate isomerase-like protein (cupin superfamily)
MKIIRSKEFRATRPWGALDIANMRGITTRLHWTDAPYHWHVNVDEEVFAVLDGRVEMCVKESVSASGCTRPISCTRSWSISGH